MESRFEQSVHVVDSHTGGEPTRVVISGGPDLGAGSMSERLALLRDGNDAFRSSVVNEPRGSDVLVGALLCEPADASNDAGVIFFNNVGYLGMCGHGTIGLAVTLAHLGRMEPGEHLLETPPGIVKVTLHDESSASVDNVASFRFRRDLTLEVPGIGEVSGDVAWGGNWFFLVSDHGQVLRYDNVAQLTEFTWAIRRELDGQGIRGPDGELIDHVELFGPPSDPAIADSRNFVLCPGRAYDRSPCGTGTSAKIACLIEDGRLEPGETWRQESITGSVFDGHARVEGRKILPVITGSAYVTAESTLLIDPHDPFRHGLTRPGDS